MTFIFPCESADFWPSRDFCPTLRVLLAMGLERAPRLRGPPLFPPPETSPGSCMSDSPFPQAFLHVGWGPAGYVVAVGILCFLLYRSVSRLSFHELSDAQVFQPLALRDEREKSFTQGRLGSQSPGLSFFSTSPPVFPPSLPDCRAPCSPCLR